MKLNYTELAKTLQKENIETTIQQQPEQLHFLISIGVTEIPFFLRIFPDGKLLQVVGFYPMNFKEEHKESVARLLHMINKDIDLPGFSMEEQLKTIFYRLCIPCLDKTISELLFTSYIKTVVLAMKSFLNVIHAVGTGKMTLQQVQREIQKAQSKVNVKV